jgi:serine phosphatase RsbU (regulator of sigma subunit)
MPLMIAPLLAPRGVFEFPVGLWLLAGLLIIILGIILYDRYLSRRELMDRVAELSELAEIGRAVGAAPLEAEELAEVAYQEAARLLETDHFQLGVYEGDTYRTLIWVREGERQANQVFELAGDEEGLVGWVRRSGKPLLVRDFQAERSSLPARPSYEADDPTASGMFVPLLVGEKAIGVIAIQSRRQRAFREHHLRLLTILANGVAAALALSSLQAQVEFRTLQLVLIQNLSARLVSLQPLPDLFAQVVALVSQSLGYHLVRLYEVTASGVLLRASSRPDAAVSEDDFDSDGGLVPRAVEEGRTLSATSPDGAPHAGLSELAVPLKVEERVLGVLNIFRKGIEPFPHEHIALAQTVAAHLALAILEARNFASQQEEAWITTVLLEVARHAAQPGDTQGALQAVLQLTTLLAGTTWAALLLPDPSDAALRLGPVSGLHRQEAERLADVRLPPEDLGLAPPFASEIPAYVTLPEALTAPLEARDATAVTLSDGVSLLGVLLLEGQELAGRRLPLIVGIAHQISLRLENTRLIEEAAARRSLERELAMARGIQESFLPNRAPAHPGWELGMTWRVARQVGGDFYDFIPLAQGSHGPRWGLVIADVADKGIPAALFMALCRTLLRSVAISRIDPGQTLTRMNDLIFADSKADLFVSIFLAVWEPETGRIAYANGGHNPPLLFEPGLAPRQLAEHGMVLGVSEGIRYETHTITLKPGCLLLLYTDGVTEAMDSSGQFFGLHRLASLVMGVPEWDAQVVADQIAQRVSDFCAEPELRDDLTAVVVRRVPG